LAEEVYGVGLFLDITKIIKKTKFKKLSWTLSP
jgi:hypothetical protein